MAMQDQHHRRFLRVVQSALRTLNTPLSLSVHLLISSREWDQLAVLAIDPQNYLDTPSGVERYRRDAQAIALVRKVPWPTSFSRKARAMATFEACERRCAETNHFVDWLLSGVRPQDRFLNACRDILGRAKKLASYILGPLPESLSGRFGPGTVFELKGRPWSTVADKVCITPHATRDAVPIFRHLFDQSSWDRERLRAGLPFITVARGNRFTTVPKDGRTDRGICVEPGGNIWSQLAVGDYMKDRLKRVGLDVARSRAPTDPIQLVIRTLSGRKTHTGQDTHRWLAEMASRDGSLATIDLSNASDTVARRLVQAILPDDWHSLLDCLRSPLTLINKRWVRLEKFSSMGNGFTFELETLLFACLSHAVAGLEPGRDLWVYGDDIVVPSRAARDVEACLEAFGFEVNRKKSYSTGFFRESCGADFFCGASVRPFFITDVPKNPLDWMELYNGLLKAGLATKHVLRLCSDEVPVRFRLYGRPGLSGVFWTSDPSSHSTFEKASIRWNRVLSPMPVRVPIERWDDWCHLVVALAGGSSSGLSPPRSIAGFRIILASVS